MEASKSSQSGYSDEGWEGCLVTGEWNFYEAV